MRGILFYLLYVFFWEKQFSLVLRNSKSIALVDELFVHCIEYVCRILQNEHYFSIFIVHIRINKCEAHTHVYKYSRQRRNSFSSISFIPCSSSVDVCTNKYKTALRNTKQPKHQNSNIVLFFRIAVN